MITRETFREQLSQAIPGYTSDIPLEVIIDAIKEQQYFPTEEEYIAAAKKRQIEIQSHKGERIVYFLANKGGNTRFDVFRAWEGDIDSLNNIYILVETNTAGTLLPRFKRK